MTPPRYTPLKLALLAAVLVGTLAVMLWIILANVRAAGERGSGPPSAQQNARQPLSPREGDPSTDAPTPQPGPRGEAGP